MYLTVLVVQVNLVPHEAHVVRETRAVLSVQGVQQVLLSLGDQEDPLDLEDQEILEDGLGKWQQTLIW